MGGKMAAKPLEKSSQLENTSRIPKKLKDLTKNLSVSEATCFSYPPQNHPKNKPGGYPLSKRGYWIPNNMSFV